MFVCLFVVLQCGIGLGLLWVLLRYALIGGFGLVLRVVCLLFGFGFDVSVLVWLRVGGLVCVLGGFNGFCVLDLLLGFVNGVGYRVVFRCFYYSLFGFGVELGCGVFVGWSLLGIWVGGFWLGFWVDGIG